jgi:CRP-like cAMP-binding protein
MSANLSPTGNRLLAALPAQAYKRLLPDLELTPLAAGETLFHPAGRLPFAYFPVSGVVTLSYALADKGPMAKGWPVGHEGMVGISLFLGEPRRDNRADVQIAGHAFRLPAKALAEEFRRAGNFQALLLRYVFALVTQASQLGLCNHRHSMEQRLCRFLSRLFDRLSDDEIALTQEQIGAMLGTRRESITEAATQLHSEGIIDYQRGHIRLLDRQKLDDRSCSCGLIIRRAFEAVFET